MLKGTSKLAIPINPMHLLPRSSDAVWWFHHRGCKTNYDGPKSACAQKRKLACTSTTFTRHAYNSVLISHFTLHKFCDMRNEQGNIPLWHIASWSIYPDVILALFTVVRCLFISDIFRKLIPVHCSRGGASCSSTTSRPRFIIKDTVKHKSTYKVCQMILWWTKKSFFHQYSAYKAPSHGSSSTFLVNVIRLNGYHTFEHAIYSWVDLHDTQWRPAQKWTTCSNKPSLRKIIPAKWNQGHFDGALYTEHNDTTL